MFVTKDVKIVEQKYTNKSTKNIIMQAKPYDHALVESGGFL